MKRKYPGQTTVADLIDELKKFDDEAIVMVSADTEGNCIVEADTQLSPAYRGTDGEIVYEDDLDKDESTTTYDKVVILWPII
jgi:sulfur carrier protein ThiS